MPAFDVKTQHLSTPFHTLLHVCISDSEIITIRDCSGLWWPPDLRFQSVVEPCKGANYGLPHVLISEIIHSSKALFGREIKNPFAKDKGFQCMKEALCSAFCRMPGFPKYARLTCAARQMLVKRLAPFLSINQRLGRAYICFTLNHLYFITALVPIWHHIVWQSQACGINRLWFSPAVCIWHSCICNGIRPRIIYSKSSCLRRNFSNKKLYGFSWPTQLTKSMSCFHGGNTLSTPLMLHLLLWETKKMVEQTHCFWINVYRYSPKADAIRQLTCVCLHVWINHVYFVFAYSPPDWRIISI